MRQHAFQACAAFAHAAQQDSPGAAPPSRDVSSKNGDIHQNAFTNVNPSPTSTDYLFTAAVPRTVAHEMPSNVITPVLEELTRFQVINSIPGMVCAVLHRGKVVLEVGSGFANVETLAPMKTDTVCRIGSISKLLATVAVDKMSLDIDRPIHEYLPWLERPSCEDDTHTDNNTCDNLETAKTSSLDEASDVEISDQPSKLIPRYVGDATIREILCHESGIRHYKTEREFRDKETMNNIKHSSARKAIKELGLDTDPVKSSGEFRYSTHAFTFLQAIIEEQTGKTYSEYIYKKILKPIGMFDTVPDDTFKIIANRTCAYDKEHGLKNAAQIDQHWKLAGGGYLSNASDLLRFGEWLMEHYHKKNHRFLAPRGDDKKWLLGFEPDIMGHTGASLGGTCALYCNADKDLVIVLLVNQTNSGNGMRRLLHRIARDF